MRRKIENNPMQPLEGKSRAKKSKVETHLKYHVENSANPEQAGSSADPPKRAEDARRITINEVRKEDCEKDHTYKCRQRVRSFLIQLEWAENEDGEGITWLELPTLFRLHGGSMTPTTKEMVPGADATTCTQEMKAFKAAVRWISTHNVSTKDE